MRSNLFGALYDHLRADELFLVAVGVRAIAIMDLALFVSVEGDAFP